MQARNQLASFAALVLAASLGCNRAVEAPDAPKLTASAPLPVSVARETRLHIGDPKVQKQLELSGLIGELPFTAEWHNISGGPQTIEAFRASALDAGAVGDTPPIHAAFTGLPVKIVAVQVRDKPSFELALAPGLRLSSLSELRGKRIAYAPGQAQGALVLRVLEKHALEPEDVQLVELTSSEFKDALASRQVDVAPLSGPNLRRYLKDQRAQTLAHGTRDSISFLYVRAEVLADPAKAAALRAYVQLRTRAQLWAAEHGERWLDAYYVKDQGLSPEDARAIIDVDLGVRFPADWSEVIALTQNTIGLLAKATGRPAFAAEELFDLRFQNLGAEAASASAALVKPRHTHDPTERR